jgi:hypothetical protein
LNGVDQSPTGPITLEAAKFLGRDDNDLVTPAHGYMLWSLAAHFAHKFAEPCLGILQQPMTWLRLERWWFR